MRVKRNWRKGSYGRRVGWGEGGGGGGAGSSLHTMLNQSRLCPSDGLVTRVRVLTTNTALSPLPRGKWGAVWAVRQPALGVSNTRRWIRGCEGTFHCHIKR